MTAPFPFDAWARPGKDALDFWISFFPTAPLFGVKWRFADMPSPAMSPFTASAVAFAAAPRPGELDSPARVDGGLDRPVEKVTEAVAAAAEDASRIAAEAGTAASRAAADLARSDSHDNDDTGAEDGRPETGKVGDETPQAAPTATTASDADPVLDESEPVDSAGTGASEPTLLMNSRPDDPPDDPDDLKTLKGIGPGVARQLNELGIWKFDQIARMSEADLAWIDERLNAIKGRCFRDDWIGQAKRLAQ